MECFEKFIQRTYLMAAHCQAVRLQNPFPNGLLIWEELQRLYIRSSHPPDGPHRSPSFRRLQPFPFPRFSHGPTCVCVCVCVCVHTRTHTRAQSCPTLVTPWTVAHNAPLSVGFSRQEYWSGLPFPSPGIFLTQGSYPYLLHWQEALFHC